MGDRTAFQCTITACPDGQQTAAARVLESYVEVHWEKDKPVPRYEVTDNTLNTAGLPIRAGQEAAIVGNFTTHADAERHIAGLPGGEDDPGRYSIDEVPGLAIDAEYFEEEVSCGAADEVASALIDAAPGIEFVLWEDPKYEWLGSLFAYTPELGVFSADCDANGTPVFDAGQIKGMIDKAGERPTAGQIRAAIDRACGVPWLHPTPAEEKCDGCGGNRLTGCYCTCCLECDEEIPPSETSEVNTYHAPSCSLHPSNVTPAGGTTP